MNGTGGLSRRRLERRRRSTYVRPKLARKKGRRRWAAFF